MDEHPRPRRNAGHPPQTSPFEQSKQDRLSLVVLRVSHCDARSSRLERRHAEKAKPPFPGCFFAAEMVLGSVCVHIVGSCFTGHAQRVCQFPHKHLVRITFGAAELMIEMGTDHVEMTAFPQGAEEA